MSIAEPGTYLSNICTTMRAHWPENRTINVVCHGHSVPAGYFATPMVDSLNAYPHRLHAALKHRFPFAVINVIVTAVGGENAESGEARFAEDVLTHRPDVISIDYGLNDRGLGLERAGALWTSMIEQSLAVGSKVILLTPTPDMTQADNYSGDDRDLLPAHADQIRGLAAEYRVGLADSFAACMDVARSGHITDLLSWSNHPNRAGHELVAKELLRWFPAA